MRFKLYTHILIGLFLFSGMFSCKTHQKADTKKESTSPVVKKTSASPPKSELASDFCQILKISEKEAKANKLYHFSETWFGVPYRYGGCDRKGVDCSCFVNVLYQQVYAKELARSAFDIYRACDEVGIEDAKEGDLLFFKIEGNKVSHVGIFLKGNYFIHASTSKGVTVNSLQEAYYKKYFFCAGKVRQL